MGMLLILVWSLLVQAKSKILVYKNDFTLYGIAELVNVIIDSFVIGCFLFGFLSSVAIDEWAEFISVCVFVCVIDADVVSH